MSEPTIDVVHVGSASRDLTEDDPRGWRLGGGASYSALTTARLGLRTAAVIGVDPAAATASELELLRAAGVELALVALDEGPVFRNEETSAGRVQASLAVGEALAIGSFPDAWRAAPVWSLAPVAGEIGVSWASAIPDGAFLALGWQGSLRHLVAGREVTRRAPVRSPLLDRADIVGVSRHDLEPGTDETGLLRFLHPGAQLLVTDGPAGGRLLWLGPDGRVVARGYAAVEPGREVDPTGAGDVFLAALLCSIVRPEGAGRVDGRPQEPDLGFAAAAASFAVEAPGLHGVPDRRAVVARLDRDGPTTSSRS